MTEASDTQPPRAGRYELREVIGAGAMGTVYAAIDPDLGRKLAIKLMRRAPDRSRAHAAADAQLREARALARLAHPNVISVYDVGDHDGQVFLAMELVDGQDLASWLARDRWRAREVLDAFTQAGRGLAAAHAAGLVHRDFKPANVLVGRDGRVRVTDFGLAREAGEASPELAGTPAYMAPELARGEPASARSDQYSFAVALDDALRGARDRAPTRVRRAVARARSPRPVDRFDSMDALLRAIAPARHGIALGTVAVAAVLALLAAFTLSGAADRASAAPTCGGAAAKLGSVWDPPTKTRIRAAYMATGAPGAEQAWRAIERALDAYGARWSRARTQACEATHVRHEQSAALLDLRMTCLDERLDEMRALTRLLESADRELVSRGLAATTELPPVDECAHTRALLTRVPPPSSPTVQHAVAEIRAKLTRASALYDAGKFVEGLAEAVPALERARTLDYLPIEAEALLAVGRLQAWTGHRDAEQMLRDAASAAEACDHHKVAAAAWLNLIFWVGFRHGQYARGDEWARYARAAIDRMGGDDDLEAHLDYDYGTVLWAEGHADASLERFRRALAKWERARGRHHPYVARALEGIAMSYYQMGRYREALALERESQSIRLETLGTTHPAASIALRFIGIILVEMGRAEEGRQSLERSVTLAEQVLGPRHPNVALSLLHLANAERVLGRYDDARAHIARAMDIVDHAYGPEHPDMARLLHLRGAIERVEAHPARALEDHMRALTILERAVGSAERASLALSRLGVAAALHDLGRESEARAQFEAARAALERDHTQAPLLTGLALAGIGRADVDERRPTEAVDVLERAVRIVDASEARDAFRGEVRFELARAVWDGRGDHARAIDLAMRARAELARGGAESTATLARADAWLRAHQ